MAAIALTTDSCVLTSVANGYGFARIFARQVEALGRAGRRRGRDLPGTGDLFGTGRKILAAGALLPELAEGQSRLAAARVALVGCGATGSALASLLARAGRGPPPHHRPRLHRTKRSQRQSLFDEADASEALPKAVAAARKILLPSTPRS